MDALKILVVEDEVIVADDICDTLQDLGYRTLSPVSSYKEAINSIESNKPDLAIIDIQLSGKETGIELAKKIKSTYNFPFIFLTSNSDSNTVKEAKEVNPESYLIKPFTKIELHRSVETAIAVFFGNDKSITNVDLVEKKSFFIKKKEGMIRLNFNDILFIRSAHVYVEIVQKDKIIHVIRTSLSQMENKLSSKFIRIHRGYIVNSNFINSFSANSVKICDEFLPVGKKYKENLLKKHDFGFVR